MVKSLVRLCAGCLVLAGSLPAAPATPRPLTYADAAGFRDLLSPALSRDGRWLASVEMPQEGDGEAVVHAVDAATVWRVPAGATPPTTFPRPSSPTEKPPAAQHAALAFTGDSAFLLVHALPPDAAQVASRVDPKKPRPGRDLAVLRLATGAVETLPHIASFQVSSRSGAILAALVEESPAPDAGAPKPAGATLIVRDLASGSSQEIARVTDYSLTRDGQVLVYVTASSDGKTFTLNALDPARDAPPVELCQGPGKFTRLSWDRTQGQLACLAESAADASPPARRILVWARGNATVRTVVDARTAGIPAGMIVSDKAALNFTPDGRKLLLGVAPPPVKFTPPADPEDRVTADLWSWNDDLIQPRQEVRAALDRDRSYRAVVNLATLAYTQLGTPEMPDVLVSDDASRALAIDYRPYYRLRDYDGTYGDIYLLDLTDGSRRRVLTKLRGGTGDEGDVTLQLSPDGRQAAYYANRQWHVLDLVDGGHHGLTEGLPVPFYNELHDQPEPATAWGFGGWSADSQSVLLYDRYDLWQVFPDGRAARNLTHGYGRAHALILRRQDLAAHEDDEAPHGVDLSGPLMMRGEDEHTRATGFLRFPVDGGEPQRLLWRDCCYYYVGRAAAADRLMLTASRFDEFPDVWITDEALSAPRRVTDGQAQLAPFRWGHAEMIDYRNSAGVPLQACLYLPADFDPAKQYPLIVYTYERLSQIIHRFFPPVAGSNISFPIYASNGYIIMLADIAYTDGHPGACAVDCIHAALDAVETRGFVDAKAIGYQGSSWGGYTAAYLLTHSDRFAAISGGAIVSNMTSAYGGVRLYSGQPRLFQYEQSQSRIGQSLAAAPELYLENSPLFTAADAHAPFLILHNDRDGAVPFEQAVEFYLSLRRHDKPVWLFNYRDEGHGLQRLANRKDFSRRMWQFFDHYLRGAPAPDWLRDGIPYLQRDEEKARFDAAPLAGDGR